MRKCPRRTTICSIFSIGIRVFFSVLLTWLETFGNSVDCTCAKNEHELGRFAPQTGRRRLCACGNGGSRHTLLDYRSLCECTIFEKASLVRGMDGELPCVFPSSADEHVVGGYSDDEHLHCVLRHVHGVPAAAVCAERAHVLARVERLVVESRWRNVARPFHFYWRARLCAGIRTSSAFLAFLAFFAFLRKWLKPSLESTRRARG